jgi:hypothetical protein
VQVPSEKTEGLQGFLPSFAGNGLFPNVTVSLQLPERLVHRLLPAPRRAAGTHRFVVALLKRLLRRHVPDRAVGQFGNPRLLERPAGRPRRRFCRTWDNSAWLSVFSKGLLAFAVKT